MPAINVDVPGDRLVDYTALRKALERAVGRICPGWLSSQRDDLVQTAVMRVMQIVNAAAPAHEGNRSLASLYLFKVAHSALVDEIRRVRRRREASLGETEELTVPAGGHLNPERIAASKQIGRGIQDCLTQMSDERRLAVTLYLQGHTVPEASRILDWPAKRTDNLVYRGLADLRECLRLKGMRP